MSESIRQSPGNQFDLQREKIKTLKQWAIKTDQKDRNSLKIAFTRKTLRLVDHIRAEQTMEKALKLEAELDSNIKYQRISEWVKTLSKKEPTKEEPRITGEQEKLSSSQKTLSQEERIYYERRLKIARALERPANEIESLERILGSLEKQEINEETQTVLSQEYREAVEQLREVCQKAFKKKEKIVIFSIPIFDKPIPGQPDKIIGQKEFRVVRLQLKSTSFEDRFVQITKYLDGTLDLSLKRDFKNENPNEITPASHNTVSAFFLKKKGIYEINTYIDDSIAIKPDGNTNVTTCSFLRKDLGKIEVPEPTTSSRPLTIEEIGAITKALKTAKIVNLNKLSSTK